MDKLDRFSQNARGLEGTSASEEAPEDSNSRDLQSTLTHCGRHGIPEKHPPATRDPIDSSGNSTVWPGQEPIQTPLLQAIRSQSPQDVESLLNSGADPNGNDTRSLEEYQSLFLRFRPRVPDYVDIDGDIADRNTLLACMNLSQAAVITKEEVADRTHCMTPFWALHTDTPVDWFQGGNDMHSVVAAARKPSTQILDRLIKAGADTSAWLRDSNTDTTSVFPKPSSLAVTSPLHAALELNIPMLPHLLSLGFDPDFIPSSTPGACLTPLMSTLLMSSYTATTNEAKLEAPLPSSELPTAFNLAAYTALVSLPSLNTTLTTPVLAIHLLHLAVAHGSLPLFKHILATCLVSPASVGPTALGHTLLHIACLSISDANMKIDSIAVAQSIHDIRSLVPLRVRHPSSIKMGTDKLVFEFPPENYEIDQAQQTELITFLVSNLPHLVAEQDYLGNTALHYLCGHTTPNMESISILRSENEEETWDGLQNRWGYSAKDLFDSRDSVEQVHEWRRDSIQKLRMKERKRNEWWEWRLTKGVGPNENSRATTRGGRGRGRGSGRDTYREEHEQEFPYHVRG